MNDNIQTQNPKPAVDFFGAEGEAFVGLNILQLKVGEADGPFVVDKIELKKFGEGKRANEIPQVTAMKGNIPYTMPIAASFVARIEDAKLAKGDTFLIMRTEDYTSKDGTEGCESYIIKVTARAK